MRKVSFLDLTKQYREISSEIDEAISNVIERAAFIGGDGVRKFEEEFSAFLGVDHTVGVANGTDALEIVLEALELPPSSEVIVPANSFIATSEAVSRAGHKVVFADCGEDDYLLDVEDVKARITPRTRAVIPVHLYGQMCDMGKLAKLACDNDMFVIEDAAQAHGALAGDNRPCSLSVAATYSFYPGKNLGAYGDGGAIATNNEGFAAKCRMIANHGRSKKYDHKFEGRNSRLDGLQAEILRVKLSHLRTWTDRRRACADIYLERLAGIDGLILPRVHPDRFHVFHLFVVRTNERDALKSFLSDRGIQTGIHYPISLPRLEAYQHLASASESFRADEISKSILSLPMGDQLSAEDVEYVCDAVSQFFEDRPFRDETSSSTASLENLGA